MSERFSLLLLFYNFDWAFDRPDDEREDESWTTDLFDMHTHSKRPTLIDLMLKIK